MLMSAADFDALRAHLSASIGVARHRIEIVSYPSEGRLEAVVTWGPESQTIPLKPGDEASS
jgi:hypothetical protein